MGLTVDRKENNKKLREASGEVSYSDPLTIFFYLLLRNEVPAGKVEELVQETVASAEECSFTNGWLAHYANNLAERIRGAETEGLKNALSKAFSIPEQDAEKEVAREADGDIEYVSESLDVDDLSSLEQKLIEASKKAEDPDAPEVPQTEKATEAVDDLLAKGLITEQEAKDLKHDIEDAAAVVEKKDEAEEIPPQDGVEQVSPEEAKDLVESAVEESELAYSIVNKAKESDGYEVFYDPEVVADEAIRILKNGNWTENAWSSLTKIGADSEEDKWKNTNEELEKIDKESSEEKE